jgi:CubicO group peptidase (beta-lactamase class C family)
MSTTVAVPAGAFDEAIAWAQAHETPWPRDPDDPGGGWGLFRNDPPPWNRLLGPVSARGPVSGVVWRAGQVLARWGEPQRVDLTFSVAKTCLALLAGVALRAGCCPTWTEPVIAQVPGIGFDTPHNAAITWRHLLQQTSEWEGSCFGLPDQVDRWRTVHDPPAAARPQGRARPLQAPGSYWEYNDVRINQLSLALLHLFGRPLPEVFARGAACSRWARSDTWRWVGYDDAWVEVDGRRVQSVPGGTHWGGGVSIERPRPGAARGSCCSTAASGRGNSCSRKPGSQRMRQPCAIAPFYGYLIWLNPEGVVFPSTPHASFFMVGAGSSIIWVDPQRAAVTVVRWIDGTQADGLFARVGAAIDRL